MVIALQLRFLREIALRGHGIIRSRLKMAEAFLEDNRACLVLQCMSPLLALSGQYSCARVCPLLEVVSAGRRNTLS